MNCALLSLPPPLMQTPLRYFRHTGGREKRLRALHPRCVVFFPCSAFHRWLLFVMLVVALAFSVPAHATILFAGGEDFDFVNLSNTTVSMAATTFSAGYARESLAVYSNQVGCTGSSTEPPINFFFTPTFTANSILWVHARLFPQSNGCTGPVDALRVYSPDGYPRIAVGQTNGSFGSFAIYTINQAGTYTQLVAMTQPCFGSSQLNQLDLYINYGTSGEVTLYCNGLQVADYTGNVTTNSATQLNQVQFSDPGEGTLNTFWSEVIVSTTNTRNMRLVTLAPAANGNTDTFDTGGVSNINETTLNQATVNASGTAGQEQEYTVSTGSFPSGSFSVLGLWLNAQAQVDTTGPQHIQGVVRTGGSDFTSSNYSPTQGAWGLVSIPFLTNPNTGNAWLTTDLTAGGFNIGFNSQN